MIRLYALPALAAGVGLAVSGCNTPNEHLDDTSKVDAPREIVVEDHPLLRGEVELTIGVLQGAPQYEFERVAALAKGPQGRIYVADYGLPDVRVFGSDGTYLFHIAGPGEGPGELRSGWTLCGMAFDSAGQLWVEHGWGFELFSVGLTAAEYLRTVHVSPLESSGGGRCGNPMFVGPTGTTIRRMGHRGEVYTGEVYLHISADGDVVSRTEFAKPDPDFGIWEWPDVTIVYPGGREILYERARAWPPPFAADVLWAHAPNGDLAWAFSPFFNVEIYGLDGTLRATVEGDVVGPVVTEAERLRANNESRETRERMLPVSPDFPVFTVPERKPVIQHMLYDEENRLWVHLWPAEADTTYRAFVYDPDGSLLHEAEWPRGIAIWRGGVTGDTALGIREIGLGVQQVVQLRFLQPSAAPDK